jgi:hypothetical protein
VSEIFDPSNSGPLAEREPASLPKSPYLARKNTKPVTNNIFGREANKNNDYTERNSLSEIIKRQTP